MLKKEKKEIMDLEMSRERYFMEFCMNGTVRQQLSEEGIKRDYLEYLPFLRGPNVKEGTNRPLLLVLFTFTSI